MSSKEAHTHKKADLFSPLIASRKQTTAYRAPTVTCSSACLQSTKSSQKVLRCFIPEHFTFFFICYLQWERRGRGVYFNPVTPPQQSRRQCLCFPQAERKLNRGESASHEAPAAAAAEITPAQCWALRRGSLARRGNGNVRWPTSIQLYKLMLSVKCQSKLLNHVGTTPLQPLPMLSEMKLNEWGSIAW